MTLFTLILIAVIILAIIGLGWQVYATAVLDGMDKVLDVSIPIIKNLTQDVQAQANSSNGNNNNMTALECAIADQSEMDEETREDCLNKMIAGS